MKKQTYDPPKRTWGRTIRDTVSLPIIWSLLPFLIVCDVVIEIYHRTCFPLYRIPYVKRSRYIRLDRHKLKYVTLLEKMGCAYCGYANGWLHYATTIAAETERYWCHIKHHQDKNDDFIPPAHHRDFVPYGNEKAYYEAGGAS